MKSINTVLFGNGINLISSKCPTWNKLLEEISNVELNDSLPNTQKYEMIISNNRFRDSVQLVTKDGSEIITRDGFTLFCKSDTTFEHDLKERISERLSSLRKNEVHKALLDLKADHYLTTNFDVALLDRLRFNTAGINSPSDCLLQSLNVKRKQSSFYYWPIHGIASSPDSILLGYDDYCSRIGDMNDYINGKNFGKSDYTNLRYRIQTSTDSKDVTSWIDLFFTSNLHIIGLGLSYDELDLWWLLNIRKRIMREESDEKKKTHLVNNRIIYYSPTYIEHDKRQILKSYNIEIEEPPYLHTDFSQRYLDLINIMKNNF